MKKRKKQSGKTRRVVNVIRKITGKKRSVRTKVISKTTKRKAAKEPKKSPFDKQVEAAQAEAAKTLGGRPQTELDPAQVMLLCEAQLSNEEIAAILGCSADTIERRFAGRLQEWKAGGVGSARRALYIGGVFGGKAAMLIHFLNNYGGTRNKMEISGKDGGAIPIDVRNKSDQELYERCNELLTELGDDEGAKKARALRDALGVDKTKA